jgi:hypothetical protein
MAHKKGAGSSKNGRESHSKRLGVKFLVDKELTLAILLFVNAALSITQAIMLELEKTIHYLL